MRARSSVLGSVLGALVVGLAGCGGKVATLDGDAGPDVVILEGGDLDTRFGDDAIPIDSAVVDSGRFFCDEPADDLVCPEPQKKGAAVCNDAAIRALSDGCFGDTADQESCQAARSKFSACSRCVLETFITDSGFLDMAPCILSVSPGSTCAKSVSCAYECIGYVCSNCDYSPGTGVETETEYGDCTNRAFSPPPAPNGLCWSQGGKDYERCLADPALRVCVPYDVTELVPFFRGACRDGGNWAKADVADGT